MKAQWKWGVAGGSEGVPGFAMFKREKERGRDEMRKKEYHKWLVEVGKEWGGPDAEQRAAYEVAGRVYAQRAKRLAPETEVSNAQQVAVDAARAKVVRSVVSERGTRKELVPTAVFCTKRAVVLKLPTLTQTLAATLNMASHAMSL